MNDLRVSTRSPEELFRTLLLPVYPSEVLEDLEAARSKDANPGGNPMITMELSRIAAAFAGLFPAASGHDVALDGSPRSIHALSRSFDHDARERLLVSLGPDGAPLLLHAIVHGAAYVGQVVVNHYSGAWLCRHPLWESRVRLVSRAGDGQLSPLMWIVRAFCDEEVGRDTLSARFRTHVELPMAKPEELPVLASPERKLPKLKNPKYDTLHKYLKAHLPEVSDLGGDFPSPERFVELGFSSLEFMLLGEGRMLLMYGPAEAGFHMFWIDVTGFAKSAYFASDAFPVPVVLRLPGEPAERLRVVLQVLGREVFHEMLWWGP